MRSRWKEIQILLRYGALALALAAAGCAGSKDSVIDERQLPSSLAASVEAQGMERYSPIMIRIFKEEGVLEVWKMKTDGRYGLAATYDICKWSGKLGPKYVEGDRQAPEGFYTVRPSQMNPNSSYHLAFNIGYPNVYDRVHGRTGSHLMVHGACSSAGCYSMTDEQIEEIYAFARDAFKGGQKEFQVQAFPFRMTAANMARYKGDPNMSFWENLKEGYDHFELTRLPPKVDVCEKRYVFNRIAAPGQRFDPAGPCPPSTEPAALSAAYASLKKSEMPLFSLPSPFSEKPRMPSISGVREAVIVADWSKRRARGERVSAAPPDPTPDQIASVPDSAVKAALRPYQPASRSVAQANVSRPAAERKRIARF